MQLGTFSQPSFGWNGLRENSRKAARAGRGNLSKIEVKFSWNMFRGCRWSFPDQEWETLQAAPNAKLHLGTAVAKYCLVVAVVVVAVVVAKVILVCYIVVFTDTLVLIDTACNAAPHCSTAVTWSCSRSLLRYLNSNYSYIYTKHCSFI